jgi:hypothetical protein
MSDKTQTSNENQEVETFTLWGVKLFQTKNDENNFVAIKNKMSQKELENDYYDSVNEDENAVKESFTGLKFLTKEDLDAVGIVHERQGQKYNLKFEVEEVEGEEPKAKLVKADKVKTWTDSIHLSLSDIRRTKETNKPFVVLYYSVKEDTFENAPNKETFIQGMNDIGLNSDLVPYKGWINFNAFVWLFENEVEKLKSYKKRKRQWTLSYEQINDEEIKIKRIFGETFDKDLLLEGIVKEISDDNKKVIIEKITNWNTLSDNKALNLLHFTTETEYLEDVEDGNNMKLTFEINVNQPTSVEVGDEVEIYLNDSNVKKIKTTKITLNELETPNVFNEPEVDEEEENKREERKVPEIDLDDDDIPFG